MTRNSFVNSGEGVELLMKVAAEGRQEEQPLAVAAQST
jgi:hypothetical protein